MPHDTELAAAIKAALAAVEIPGGGDLAGYGGLSDIIVTPGAVAFAIAVAPGMEAAFGPAREAAVAAAQQIAGTRKVIFRGSEMSLSAAALEAVREMGYNWTTVRGAEYWAHEDVKLSAMAIVASETV